MFSQDLPLQCIQCGFRGRLCPGNDPARCQLSAGLRPSFISTRTPQGIVHGDLKAFILRMKKMCGAFKEG
jgi:hypothetical protein